METETATVPSVEQTSSERPKPCRRATRKQNGKQTNSTSVNSKEAKTRNFQSRRLGEVVPNSNSVLSNTKRFEMNSNRPESVVSFDSEETNAPSATTKTGDAIQSPQATTPTAPVSPTAPASPAAATQTETDDERFGGKDETDAEEEPENDQSLLGDPALPAILVIGPDKATSEIISLGPATSAIKSQGTFQTIQIGNAEQELRNLYSIKGSKAIRAMQIAFGVKRVFDTPPIADYLSKHCKFEGIAVVKRALERRAALLRESSLIQSNTTAGKRTKHLLQWMTQTIETLGQAKQPCPAPSVPGVPVSGTASQKGCPCIEEVNLLRDLVVLTSLLIGSTQPALKQSLQSISLDTILQNVTKQNAATSRLKLTPAIEALGKILSSVQSANQQTSGKAGPNTNTIREALQAIWTYLRPGQAVPDPLTAEVVIQAIQHDASELDRIVKQVQDYNQVADSLDETRQTLAQVQAELAALKAQRNVEDEALLDELTQAEMEHIREREGLQTDLANLLAEKNAALTAKNAEHAAAIQAALDEKQRAIEALDTQRLTELQQATAGKEAALAELENQKRQALADAEQSKRDELAALEAEKAAAIAAKDQERVIAIEAQQQEAQRALVALEAQRLADLQAAQQEKETALAELENQKRQALEAAEQSKRDELAALETEKAAAIAAKDQERVAAIEAQQQQAQQELDTLQQQFQTERDQLTSNAETRLQDALAERNAQHAAAIQALEDQHAATIEQLNAQHAIAIQTLQVDIAELELATVPIPELRAASQRIPELEQQIETLQATITRLTDEHTRQQTAAEEARDQLATRLREQGDALTTLTTKLDECKARVEDLEPKAQELDETRRRLDECTRTRETDANTHATELANLRQEIATAQAAIAQLELQKTSSDAEKELLQQNLATEQAKLKSKEKALETFTKNGSDKDAQHAAAIEELEQRIAELTTDVQSKIQALASETIAKQAAEQALAQSKDNCALSNDRVRELLKDAEDYHTEAERVIQEKESNIAKAKTQIDTLRAADAEQKKTIQTLSSELQTAQAEKTTAELEANRLQTELTVVRSDKETADAERVAKDASLAEQTKRVETQLAEIQALQVRVRQTEQAAQLAINQVGTERDLTNQRLQTLLSLVLVDPELQSAAAKFMQGDESQTEPLQKGVCEVYQYMMRILQIQLRQLYDIPLFAQQPAIARDVFKLYSGTSMLGAKQIRELLQQCSQMFQELFASSFLPEANKPLVLQGRYPLLVSVMDHGAYSPRNPRRLTVDADLVASSFQSFGQMSKIGLVSNASFQITARRETKPNEAWGDNPDMFTPLSVFAVRLLQLLYDSFADKYAVVAERCGIPIGTYPQPFLAPPPPAPVVEPDPTPAPAPVPVVEPISQIEQELINKVFTFNTISSLRAAITGATNALNKAILSDEKTRQQNFLRKLLGFFKRKSKTDTTYIYTQTDDVNKTRPLRFMQHAYNALKGRPEHTEVFVRDLEMLLNACEKELPSGADVTSSRPGTASTRPATVSTLPGIFATIPGAASIRPVTAPTRPGSAKLNTYTTDRRKYEV